MDNSSWLLGSPCNVHGLLYVPETLAVTLAQVFALLAEPPPIPTPSSPTILLSHAVAVWPRYRHCHTTTLSTCSKNIHLDFLSSRRPHPVDSFCSMERQLSALFFLIQQFTVPNCGAWPGRSVQTLVGAEHIIMQIIHCPSDFVLQNSTLPLTLQYLHSDA